MTKCLTKRKKRQQFKRGITGLLGLPVWRYNRLWREKPGSRSMKQLVPLHPQSWSRTRWELALGVFLFLSLLSSPGPSHGMVPQLHSFGHTPQTWPGVYLLSPNPASPRSIVKCSFWPKFKEGRFKLVSFQRLRRWARPECTPLWWGKRLERRWVIRSIKSTRKMTQINFGRTKSHFPPASL